MISECGFWLSFFRKHCVKLIKIKLQGVIVLTEGTFSGRQMASFGVLALKDRYKKYTYRFVDKL